MAGTAPTPYSNPGFSVLPEIWHTNRNGTTGITTISFQGNNDASLEDGALKAGRGYNKDGRS
ncbi:MAG: hypothetical protein FWG10_09490 [Eubacteriaceae bacterium]|nr:hypothetical protein [Eubacteriaceae bacterium]